MKVEVGRWYKSFHSHAYGSEKYLTTYRKVKAIPQVFGAISTTPVIYEYTITAWTVRMNAKEELTRSVYIAHVNSNYLIRNYVPITDEYEIAMLELLLL